MQNTITNHALIYNGIRISSNATGATVLNQRFASVSEAISFIDRNFYQ